MRALPFAFRKAASGGGGAGAWYDSTTTGLATDTTDITQNDFCIGGSVVPSVSGTASKIRVYFPEVINAGAAVKMQLATSSGTLLGSGATVLGAVGWHEVTLSSPVAGLVNGTTYSVVTSTSANGNAKFAVRLSSSGAKYNDSFNVGYDEMPASCSLGTDGTKQCLVGIFIT